MSSFPAKWPSSANITLRFPSALSAFPTEQQARRTRIRPSYNAHQTEISRTTIEPSSVKRKDPNNESHITRHKYKQHSFSIAQPFAGTQAPASRFRHGRSCTGVRHFSTGEEEHTEPLFSRRELVELMDYYNSEETSEITAASGRSVEDHETLVQDHKANAQEESYIQQVVRHLERVLRNPRTNPELLADLYNNLPPPGAARLSQQSLEILLMRLSRVPYKSQKSMLRYLHIITDMRSAGRHVSVSAWTTAIAFAGRCIKTITASEIESALLLWKQMESQAGIKANEVTFNVLFDVASKAGKFVLAEMLLREMKARGHQFNRYMRVNLMYYYGLKKDGTGVRRAYRELVESGEIVDTTVMSCAVAALLQAGEPVAAEQVFERAKRLHVEKGGTLPLPPHDWQERRDLGRTLMKAAIRFRDATPQERKKVQDATPLAPGVHAYKVLVYYYAVKAGDIEKVSTLVDEMAWYQIPVQGAIFLYLFKGFATHGGLLYSGWTRERLEMTFQAFLDAVEEARGTESTPDSAPKEAQNEQMPSSPESTDGKSASADIRKAMPDPMDPKTASTAFAETSFTDQANGQRISFTNNFQSQRHPSDITHISRAACYLCLSAYMRVVDATRVGEVWSQLQLLWMPTARDRDAVETYLIELHGRKQKWDRYPRISRARSGLGGWLT